MQIRYGRVGAASVLLTLSVFALGACGEKASSLAARDHGEAGVLDEGAGEVRQISAPIRVSRPRAETASVSSGIAWASSSRATGAENAQARFDRYGAEFDAATPEAYAAQARAFLRRPPAGAQVIERANGDRLVYDAKANVFAVANDEGLPRTFFHPRDGEAYWAEQKTVEARRTQAGSRRRTSEG